MTPAPHGPVTGGDAGRLRLHLVRARASENGVGETVLIEAITDLTVAGCPRPMPAIAVAREVVTG